MALTPRTCEHCGERFLPSYRVTAAYWSTRRFCSDECRQYGMRGAPRSTKGRVRVPLVERFWRKVDQRGPDECWLWRGSREKAGYGIIHAGPERGRFKKAHRVSWELHHGPIPEGMCVCHHCDVRACVNPRHLFLGTLADNNRDRDEKGRSRFGTRPKIDRETASAIREYVAAGHSQQAAADRFGLSQPHVSRIMRGENWS